MMCLRPCRKPSRIVVLAAACGAFLAGGCASQRGEAQRPIAEESRLGSDLAVIPFADVRWGALNPARGEDGPRAADLWGDRAGSEATGFLVRFADGFSSPPHVHNTTYRGIVIEGFIHNDDPDAVESWMPPGSYWTQPAGEVHITSAQGDGRLAYIEIQRGPYLVMPPEEAIDNGERAVNVHAANLVWLDASTTTRIALPDHVSPESGPRISFLWGDPQDNQPSGSLIALPADYTTTLRAADPSVRIVVIRGRPHLHQPGVKESTGLRPGSFVGSEGPRKSRITISSVEESWLYVRCNGFFELLAAPSR